MLSQAGAPQFAGGELEQFGKAALGFQFTYQSAAVLDLCVVDRGGLRQLSENGVAELPVQKSRCCACVFVGEAHSKVCRIETRDRNCVEEKSSLQVFAIAGKTQRHGWSVSAS